MRFLKAMLFLVMWALFAQLAWGQCDLTETHRLDPADGAAGDGFGRALAVDGDVLLVGAPKENDPLPETGAVRVYRFDGNAWILEQKLLPEETPQNDHFGESVAVSGDVAIVGSPRDDPALSGSVYIYRFGAGIWTLEQHLLERGGGDLRLFGSQVAIDGAVVVAAAVPAPGGGADRTYVYRFDGTSWIEEQELPAAGGVAVAIQGDVIMMGTRSDRVHVFRHDGFSWVEEQVLAPSDGYPGFGRAISMDADFAAVGTGAPFGDGRCYVFQFDGSNWNQTAVLSLQAGSSVAVEGDVVLVGRTSEDSDTGAVHAFRLVDGQWVEEPRLVASDRVVDDRFGWSVSLSGGRAVVGAPNADVESGRAYSFATIPMLDGSREGYGVGWPGTLGIPTVKALTDPVVGSLLSLWIENSLGAPTLGVFLGGIDELAKKTPLGGTLLVAPILARAITIPRDGVLISGPIPDDCGLAGVSFLVQVLEEDAGASQGVSFTAGLRLNPGLY